MSKRKSRKEADVPSVSGQTIFIEEMKPQLEIENPCTSKLEIYRMLNDMWKNLNGYESGYYSLKAQDKQRAINRTQKYRRKKEKKERKKKISSYSIFVTDMHEELKSTSPEMTLRERTQAISQMWLSMSQMEKVPYINRAKQINRKFAKVSDDEEDSLFVNNK